MPQTLWHKGSGGVTQQAGNEPLVCTGSAQPGAGHTTNSRNRCGFCLLGAYGLLEKIDSLISHTNNCEITLVGSAEGGDTVPVDSGQVVWAEKGLGKVFPG